MTKDRTADALIREAEAARSLIAEIGDDDDELTHDMVEGETSLIEAVTRAIDEIDGCDVVAEGCKAKEAQLAERRRKAEARRERLRGLIEQALLICDMRALKLPTATLSVKDVPPKPIISDETKIPSIYWRQPDPVLDKKKINDDAKAGEAIPGVSMSNGATALQIRRV